MEKVIGRVESRADRSSKDGTKHWLSIKVNGVELSVWEPLKSAMSSVQVGQNIEVEFERKGNFASAKAWAIQGDNVPATTTSAPAAPQSYGRTFGGKSPEERMSILCQSANHDATALLVPWITAALAGSEPDWFPNNWEKVAKAHANLSAAIVDASLDYLSHSKDN